MKTSIRYLMLSVVLSAGSCIAVPNASQEPDGVSLQLFYDQLSPYGTWVDYQDYGYVWIPDVNQEFTPYGTDGHWIFTDDGWTWISDYSWGWAPFHYGRWAYDDSYGWFWLPQNEWGPAWVTWRRSAGYYGWSPMGPGVTPEVSFGGGYRDRAERWIFVSDRDFGRTDIAHHYMNRSSNAGILNNSSVINNTHEDRGRHATYITGPARDEVQKITGADVRTIVIQDNNSPGQSVSNDQLRIYRPRFQELNSPDRTPRPSRVASLREITPVSRRTPGNQQKSDTRPTNGNQEPSQPQTVKPSDIPVKNTQAPDLNPPNRNKRTELPSGNQPASPNETKSKGQEPGYVKPNDMKHNLETLPQPQNARPSEQNRTGQQPWIGKQPEDAKNDATPASIKLPDVRVKNQHPQATIPPAQATAPGRPSAPGKSQQLNNGKRVMKPAVPPNSTGEGRETQRPKENRQQQNSTKNHS